MVKRILTIGLLSFAISGAKASDTLRTSLDDIISKALLNSKQIEQSRLQIEEHDLAVKQQRMELLPEISLRGSASYATNMPIYDQGIFNKPSQHDVIHYLYDTGVDFYLNLYNGHKDLMKIESRKLEELLASIEWANDKARIKLDVCNLFLTLERSYMDKKLIESDIGDQKAQLQEINNLYHSGVVLHSDVLRMELELSKRELLLVQIAHDIQALNQKLKFIVSVDAEIIPIPHDFNVKVESYEDAWSFAQYHAFSLQKSEQEIRLKQLAIKQSQANYLPELSLIGNFTFANPQIMLYPYNNSWYNLGIVGLKLKIPISSIYHNKHIVQEAKISLEREEVRHHLEQEQIQNQLLQAHLDYKLACVQRDVCIKNVGLAKENARIIKNRYFKSSALVTDLLDADMEYLKTLFELETAKIAIQKHYYFIEFLKGTI
ncbi:TolC family protein [Sphingobacterium faecium]|uniref:TolC family protein n=1 Tax=Sphingobacterium faecium TaxID=34087 RepID=UPI0021B64E4D|nr:TolC family protein [Sphingobacterium faecium]UXD67710.1 TolC family protein [Sphingobacterium faecium]